MITTILFDLDGTLIDTAPDMANALNLLLNEEQLKSLPYETIRPHVSNGSVALVKLGFGEDLDKQRLEHLKQRYLDIYKNNLHIASTLFDGMAELLINIESQNKKWGVVTNKPSWLTEPLLASMGLFERAACVVSGDTIEHRKPHPAPMLYACQQAGSTIEQCIYIGDARRDIEAGNNANMKTVVALYGYIGDWENPMAWGADETIKHPEEILQCI